MSNRLSISSRLISQTARRPFNTSAFLRVSDLVSKRPDPSINYFSLFDLTHSYNVPLPALKSAFLKLQRQVHPDAFSGQDELESRAHEWSELVNKAYKTLSNPLERAEYCLGLKGVEIAESESLEDPELLMEVMEVREQVEDANTQREIDQIRQENKQSMSETMQRLRLSLEKDDLVDAKAMTVKLRYLSNVDNVCREWSGAGQRVEIQH